MDPVPVRLRRGQKPQFQNTPVVWVNERVVDTDEMAMFPSRLIDVPSGILRVSTFINGRPGNFFSNG